MSIVVVHYLVDFAGQDCKNEFKFLYLTLTLKYIIS